MSYFGSEIDQEWARIVRHWERRVRNAVLAGVASGLIVGFLTGWLVT